MRNKLETANELIGKIYANMIMLVNLWQTDHDEIDHVLAKNYPFGADLWELAEEVGSWMESIDKEMRAQTYREKVLNLALGTFLSYYPENVSPDEIMTAMINGENTIDGEEMDIVPWEPFQYWQLPDLVEQIELLYNGVLELTEKRNEVI